MKKGDTKFINLTSRAIIHDISDDGSFLDEDWENLYNLAYQSNLVAITYDVAKAQSSLPEDLRKKWDFVRFQTFVRQKKHFHALIDLIRAIEAEDIDYAIFKGIVVADTYPNSAYRASADSDILVDEKDAPRVCQMIEERGYVLNEHKTKAKVFVYQNEETNHMIELHTSVYEDFEGKKIEMLRAAELEAPSKRIYVDIDGERVRTLGHNEHLVYQMFHIIKHFMLEGAKIRFFTDITLFVNRYYDELSKEYFWDMMDKLNYGYFCENFMTICVEYFGMKPEFLAGRKAKASKEVLEAMIVDFIYKGDESQLRSENWQLTATLEPYLTGELTSVNSSKSGRIIRFIFPKSNELGERYTYAKKYPVLLPIAWIHRFGYKIIWQLFERQEEQYTAMEKMEVVENRLGLMSSVGLLDEE